MIAVVHQPEFVPWLGFFERLTVCDVCIILDHAQFQKRGFINRNRIKTDRGPVWLTIPIVHEDSMKPINEVRIQAGTGWQKKQWRRLEAYYRHAPHFKEYASPLKDIMDREWGFIAPLDVALIRYCMVVLKIDIPIKLSSELRIEGKSSEMLVHICQSVGADTYLSGIGGKRYMDFDTFERNAIKVMFQEFVHPEYPQQFSQIPFVPSLSILDLLFNCGEKSVDIIRGNRV